MESEQDEIASGISLELIKLCFCLELSNWCLFLVSSQTLNSETFDYPTLQVNTDNTVWNHWLLSFSFFFKGSKVNVGGLDNVLKNIGLAFTPKERWGLLKTLPVNCEHFWFLRLQGEFFGGGVLWELRGSQWVYDSTFVCIQHTEDFSSGKIKIKSQMETIWHGGSIGTGFENFLRKKLIYESRSDLWVEILLLECLIILKHKEK